MLNLKNILGKLRGVLIMIVGNMGSGKTTRLVAVAEDPTIQRNGVLVIEIRSGKRNRDKSLRSRIATSGQATAVVSSLAQLLNVVRRSRAQTICIDEIQLAETFPEGPEMLFTALLEILDSGRDLYITGLPRNFRGLPFRLVADLIAVADKREFLTTSCRVCGAPDGDLPQRLEFGQPVPKNHPLYLPDTPANNLNGITYEARCPRCHQLPDIWNQTSVAIHQALEQAGNRDRKSRPRPVRKSR